MCFSFLSSLVTGGRERGDNVFHIFSYRYRLILQVGFLDTEFGSD